MQTVDETVTYRSRSRHIIHSEKLKTVEERDGVSIASELLGFDTATDGQIKRAEIRVRPSGAVDIIKDIEVKDPISTAIEYEDKADDESTRVVREDLSQPAVSGLAVDLTPNVGERMTAEVRYDPDSNTLDVTRRTETGKEMVGRRLRRLLFTWSPELLHSTPGLSGCFRQLLPLRVLVLRSRFNRSPLWACPQLSSPLEPLDRK